jgi:hypothetical protein
VSARRQWSYVQARLHARHGERLQEADWRALEAARSIDQFIERARMSSLRRFTERLNPRLSIHAIERMLRAVWREYVGEVASWVPAEWRSAVLWTSRLPELPVIDTLLKGAVPDWVRLDVSFAEFIETDPQRQRARLTRSPLDPLVASDARPGTLATRWSEHWSSLWPHRAADDSALRDLAAAITAQAERLDRAGPEETSAPYRRDLVRGLTRLFRRHSAAPVAVFCHLALVAIDLERLRGGLVRRRLFEPGHAKEPA